MTKKFLEMTDDEIKVAFRKLAMRCQHSNDPAAVFKAAVKDELECPWTVAADFSSKDGSGQRMSMFMVSSPNTGKTLSI